MAGAVVSITDLYSLQNTYGTVLPGLDEVAHCGDVDYNAWGTSVVANQTVKPAVLDSNPTYLPSMLKNCGKQGNCALL